MSRADDARTAVPPRRTVPGVLQVSVRGGVEKCPVRCVHAGGEGGFSWYGTCWT